MLAPKKVKHRKWHKGRNRNRKVSLRGTRLSHGIYGMKAEGSAWINSRQIESARRTITNFTKREGKLWIKIFPDKPITKKAAEVGMGKGKGAVDHYVFPVKPGRILFEMDGLKEEKAREAIKRASYKLPIKVRFIKKES